MTCARYLTFTAVAGLTVVLTAAIPTPLKFVWNVSASVPVGLYRVEPVEQIAVTDLLAVNPPEPLASFMIARGYIGRDVPLLKRVMGLPGQRVCRQGRSITVDGVPIGDTLERDRIGRSLPIWRGCRRIADGELFLMNPDVSDSLDGRYFGPIAARDVVGRATPLWTDEQDDGRFVWHAPTR
ncbi:MAG: S26 family signal peptidase [Pelagibacterium sp. SCN 64-44]|nr:MAG: S26 family signal peptidase [Pelagibacterium sp. SCN 64-44]